ncbi:MAG: MBOAT family O-acyltransferase [Lachnospiraceae bacterium]
MVFSSIPFLFFFFPTFFLCYFLLPKQCRNYVLLFFSLLFYAWGEPVYVFLMIGVSFSDYLLGRLMQRFDEKPLGRRLCLSASLLVDLAALGFFKYADFLVDTVNHVFGTSLPLLSLSLPIGISFFVFQSLSYTIDLYRREVTVEKSFPEYLMYVSMFPQLIAGPIVRFQTVREELHHRVIRRDEFFDGGMRFLVGLFKKVLIANQLGLLWESAKQLPSDELGFAMAWLGAAAFTLQLYFDFSAYSDMAIGLGRMLGFHFMENFNYPLAADSVTEFWRRWHISLSTWFRDYVYIPLGGNRCKVGRHLFNIAVVWFLTGLWHGASWNYVLWGVYYGVLLCMEKYVWGRALKKLPAFFRHLYLLVIVIVGFTIFAIEDLGSAVSYLGVMFFTNGVSLGEHLLFYLKNYGTVLLAAVLFAAPTAVWLKKKAEKLRGTAAKLVSAGVCAVCLVLFVVTVSYLVADTYNPFLYFRF